VTRGRANGDFAAGPLHQPVTQVIDGAGRAAQKVGPRPQRGRGGLRQPVSKSVHDAGEWRHIGPARTARGMRITKPRPPVSSTSGRFNK
jgi:hypothetical protein